MLSYHREFSSRGGYFDVERNIEKARELEALSQSDDFWNDNEKAQAVLKDRSLAQGAVDSFKQLESLLQDAQTAFELAGDDIHSEMLQESLDALQKLEGKLTEQEFLYKMNQPYDRSPAIIEVNAGSGGTEAQDWAEMLLRMYVRWAERKGFTLEELDYQPGEGAGIKSATLLVTGPFAYGYLRSENGVHRLVRISPFDANARRHTSFASVSIMPDIEEELDVEVDERDLKMDTYRAGGKGGQHVNKTDSAVRLTHIPTGVVVACQSERSQHKNRARAMKLLKAKLFELQQRAHAEKLDEIKGERRQIDFGSQIRSYVLQPYQLIKDLRTDFETSDVQKVLDGGIDPFIEAFLMQALSSP